MIRQDIAGVARDVRNTAPETRARYGFQDHIAAIRLLDIILENSSAECTFEHSTDFTLIGPGKNFEFVSVKHREPVQVAHTPWTLGVLKSDGIIKDLFNVWHTANQDVIVTFETNGTWQGTDTVAFRNACITGNTQAMDQVVPGIAKHLGQDEATVRRFIGAFNIPLQPRPGRDRVHHLVREKIDAFLGGGYTKEAQDLAYAALMDIIRAASSDDAIDSSQTRGITIDLVNERQAKARSDSRTLSTHAVIVTMRQAAGSLANSSLTFAAAADPEFAGRVDELSKLRGSIGVDRSGPFRTVVLEGLSGSGKTSIALEFAASELQTCRHILIDASSRRSLIDGLRSLEKTSHNLANTRDTSDLEQYSGSPVLLPKFPAGRDTLVILDGVTDRATVEGLVPTEGDVRVVVTSTVTNLNGSFILVPVRELARTDSIDYLSQFFTSESESDLDLLADRLGDYPLALSQAAHYCRHLGISSHEYMNRLTQQYTATLQAKSGSFLQRTVHAAIDINVRSLSSEPRSLVLLKLLATLGSDAVPRNLFDRGDLRLFDHGNDSSSSAARGYCPVDNDQLSDQPQNNFQFHGADAEIGLLRGWLNVDAAISGLLDRSLVRQHEGNLVLHPVVRQLVRDSLSPRRDWAHGILGYVYGADETSKEGFSLSIDQVAHLISVAEMAEGDEYSAIYVRLYFDLIERLNDIDDAIEARRWAEVAYELCSREVGHPGLTVQSRRYYAQALFATGEHDHGVRLLTSVLHDSVDAETVDLSWERNQLSMFYDLLGDAENARKYLVTPASSSNPDIHASWEIERIRSGIKDAPPEEVQKSMDEFLNRLSENKDIGGRVRHQALTVAIEIAITGSHYSRWHDHALKLLANSEEFNLGPSLKFDALSTLTGWAMTVGDVRAARDYLDESRILAKNELAAHGGSQMKLLAAEARLELIQGNVSSASEKYAKVVPQLRSLGIEARLMAEHLYNFGVSSLHAGSLAQALAAATEAYELDTKKYGSSHPEARLDAELVSEIRKRMAANPDFQF